MTRPTRSYGAITRAMQLSRMRLHVFVEGRDNDGFVYGELCDSALGRNRFTHRIWRPDEISGDPSLGGKGSLIAIYRYLRRRGLLNKEFGGRRYSVLFCLDKDVDDLLRTQLRPSAHVLYTEGYDIESHLYRDGDLPKAVASALGVRRQQVLASIPSSIQWCDGAIAIWKEWTALCLLALRVAPTLVNFGRPSAVNPSELSPADPVRVQQYLNQVSASSGIPVVEVQMKYERIVNRINADLAQDRAHRYFKGKWYTYIICASMSSAFPIEYARSAFRPSLATSLRMGFADVSPWAQAAKQKISAAAALAT